METRYYENYGTTSKRLTKTVYNAYNGLGYLTETGAKGADGKISEKYVFEYDSLGRLIRSVEYAYTYSGSTVTCEMLQRTEHSYDTENRLSSQSWVIGDTDMSVETGIDRFQTAYDYDLDGVRCNKYVDNIEHNYITQNGKVVRETIKNGSSVKVLDFIYDESGRPFALKYSTNGGRSFTTYYYFRICKAML